MTARLKRIELEGFRGFAERRGIDLDADVVIIRGDNGTGKTSLVDGLLWLFTGELAHLTVRVKGLRQTEDSITNRFQQSDAVVSLTLGTSSGDQIFTRKGNQKKNRLFAHRESHPVLEGAQAEEALAAAFGMAGIGQLCHAVLTWGLLRQDAIGAALEEGGASLYQRIAGLIGLEEVNQFALAASAASTDLSRKRTDARAAMERAVERHRDATQRRGIAQKAAANQPDVAAVAKEGLAAAAAKLPDGVELVLDPWQGQSLITQIGEDANLLTKALEVLDARQRDLVTLPEGVAELLVEAEEAASRAKQAAAESVERAPIMVQLASSAIDLLGDHCPVCEQDIDQVSVRIHLQEVLDRSQDLVARSREAQDAFIAAEADLARARGAMERRRIATEEVRTAEAEVRDVASAIEDRIVVSVADFGQPVVETLLTGLRATVSEIAGLRRSVNEVSGPHVARLADEVETSVAGLAAAERGFSELERRYESAKALERAAHGAAEAILSNALEELQPSFAEVFDRLRPSVAFTKLLASQDIMRNRNQIIPVVRDQEWDINANPLLVFSEGQLNVVALSYFLGMALNARDASLPFLVLDDPLQSLDVIAILGFSDLCRQMRGQRQLILTTHDRRFADVLVRKLSPRGADETLLVHDFEGWERKGPLMKTTCPDPEPVLRIVGQAS
ncbi:MAG TPA: AAA family ATPase [Solirubrobacterales bacterium]|nr:AAA family ATPase [Solirubrobacterales bacterium]